MAKVEAWAASHGSFRDLETAAAETGGAETFATIDSAPPAITDASPAPSFAWLLWNLTQMFCWVIAMTCFSIAAIPLNTDDLGVRSPSEFATTVRNNIAYVMFNYPLGLVRRRAVQELSCACFVLADLRVVLHRVYVRYHGLSPAPRSPGRRGYADSVRDWRNCWCSCRRTVWHISGAAKRVFPGWLSLCCNRAVQSRDAGDCLDDGASVPLL